MVPRPDSRDVEIMALALVDFEAGIIDKIVLRALVARVSRYSRFINGCDFGTLLNTKFVGAESNDMDFPVSVGALPPGLGELVEDDGVELSERLPRVAGTATGGVAPADATVGCEEEVEPKGTE